MKKLGIAVALAFALGCGGASSLVQDDRPVVRMVSAVQGTSITGMIDTGPSGVTILNNAPFSSAAVARVGAGSGGVTIRDGGNGNFLAAGTHDFISGANYTVVAYGDPSSTQIAYLQDSFDPTPGNAAVRFLQAGGIAAPMVDVFYGPAGSTIAQATQIQDNITTSSIMLFRDIPAGTTKFFVTESGNNNNVLVTSEVALEQGHHYSLIFAPNGPMHLITVTED